MSDFSICCYNIFNIILVWNEGAARLLLQVERLDGCELFNYNKLKLLKVVGLTMYILIQSLNKNIYYCTF